jgi:hypothetical protein
MPPPADVSSRLREVPADLYEIGWVEFAGNETEAEEIGQYIPAIANGSACWARTMSTSSSEPLRL